MSYDGPSFVGLSDFEVLSKFSFPITKIPNLFFSFSFIKENYNSSRKNNR